MAEDLEPEARDESDRDEGDDWDDDSEGLTPEAVAYRSFSAARRGVSETEVREFLQEVAAELAAAVGRERDLLGRIHALEERAAHLEANPPKPTEEQLLEHLGEETARVLRSAQEAADEIRASASKRAQTIVDQAESEAARLRHAAQNVMDEKTREADIAATVTMREAEGHAQARMREVEREAETELESARQRGREMVAEARSVRERILADLGKRRSTVQGEIAQLEAVRERIIESGRLVRERLAQAAAAFEPFEPHEPDEPEAGEEEPEEEEEEEGEGAEKEEGPAAAAEPAGEEEPEREKEASGAPPAADAFPVLELVETPEELSVVDDEPEEEPDGAPEQADADEAEPESAALPEPDVPDFVAQGPEPEVPEFVEPNPVAAVPERPRVDELFARIRAGRDRPGGEAGVALAPEPAPEHAPGAEAATEEVEVVAEPEPPQTGDGALLARRDEVLAPVSQDVLRRAKRALQDEQNELLDRLRRERGRADAEHLLAPLSAQVTDWADVLEPAVNEAYAAGRAAQQGDDSPQGKAPRRLVSGLAEVLITPFRERLVATLDAAPAEPGPEREAELSSRVGARYREWRGQELDIRVGDLLAAAYAKGVYDAAPEGAQLRWIPARVGECPDADDNALEPTVRGSHFPTGQPFPPAHPGCRCLIAVSDPD